jgi:hypothetical protein
MPTSPIVCITVMRFITVMQEDVAAMEALLGPRTPRRAAHRRVLPWGQAGSELLSGWLR